MILVCPSCTASFKIPDGAIPPGGRTVRCAKCKHSWRADPAQILTASAPQAAPVQRPVQRPAPPVYAAPVPNPDLDAGLAARAAAVRRTVATETPDIAPAPRGGGGLSDDEMFEDEDHRPRAGASGDLDGEDDFGISRAVKSNFGGEFDGDDEDPEDGFGDDENEEAGEGDEAYDDDDFLARRRSEQRRHAEREAVARKRKLILVLAGGLVLFWLTVLTLLVFFKEEVVYKMPGMTNFYSMFEGVSDVERFRPEEGETLSKPITEAEVYVTATLLPDMTRVENVEGRSTLMVRGFVHNKGQTAANVPQVLVNVLDNSNRELTRWVADPPGRVIRRGGKLDFETSLYPIPAGAATVEVESIEGSRSTTEAQIP